MSNNRTLYIGSLLSALGIWGCIHVAVASDPKAPDSGRVLTQPGIVGSQNTGIRNIHGFVGDIDKLATANQDFRHVLYTANHAQLVVMSLKPGEDIGSEVHSNVDQFLRVEEGTGDAVLDNVHAAISAGSAVLIPAGTKHDIVNTGSTPMKLYTLYSPPQHRDGVVHHTRADAEQDREHFDGKTSQ